LPTLSRWDGQRRKNKGARPEYLNEQGMIFGAHYTSTAIVPDGTDTPHVLNPVTDYVQSARPGGRAPHVWLESNGTRTSTIDLVGNGFALLTAAGGKAWSEAAKDLATEYPLRLKTIAIDDTGFMSAYDLDEDGAVLVRPDGYVGWRSRSKASNSSRTRARQWQGFWVGISNACRAAQGIAECEQSLALDQNLAGAHTVIGAAKHLSVGVQRPRSTSTRRSASPLAIRLSVDGQGAARRCSLARRAAI
jgi:hypothetical protein